MAGGRTAKSPTTESHIDSLKYLHTILRVTDLEASLHFYGDALGLEITRRGDVPAERFTLVYLAPPSQPEAEIELTHNWEPEVYVGGRNFGHVPYAVDDIYAACERSVAHGVVINQPPHDGRMAFVRSPDSISIELLQARHALAPDEPWSSMPNVGAW